MGSETRNSPIMSKSTVVARLGRPIGLDGALALTSFTEEPEAVFTYSTLHYEDGAPVSLQCIRRVSPSASRFVVRITGVTTREEADAVKNRCVFLPKAELPILEDEHVYYVADLIGLKVMTRDGQHIGTIVRVDNFGSSDVITIQHHDSEQTFMLPFTHRFFPEVNVELSYVYTTYSISESER